MDHVKHFGEVATSKENVILLHHHGRREVIGCEQDVTGELLGCLLLEALVEVGLKRHQPVQQILLHELAQVVPSSFPIFEIDNLLVLNGIDSCTILLMEGILDLHRRDDNEVRRAHLHLRNSQEILYAIRCLLVLGQDPVRQTQESLLMLFEVLVDRIEEQSSLAIVVGQGLQELIDFSGEIDLIRVVFGMDLVDHHWAAGDWLLLPD